VQGFDALKRVLRNEPLGFKCKWIMWELKEVEGGDCLCGDRLFTVIYLVFFSIPHLSVNTFRPIRKDSCPELCSFGRNKMHHCYSLLVAVSIVVNWSADGGQCLHWSYCWAPCPNILHRVPLIICERHLLTACHYHLFPPVMIHNAQLVVLICQLPARAELALQSAPM
jgi:hypothetical protein